jgi:hypothetical protein
MHIVYFITWPITHRWTVDGTNGTISTRSLFPVAHRVRPLPAVLDRSPLRTLQLALRKSHPRNFARLPSARWRRVATLGGGLGRTAAPPSPPSIAPKTCTNKGTFGGGTRGEGKIEFVQKKRRVGGGGLRQKNFWRTDDIDGPMSMDVKSGRGRPCMHTHYDGRELRWFFVYCPDGDYVGGDWSIRTLSNS